MPMEGQLAHISPYESIRKVRGLIQKGNIWTQEIILSVTPSELTIKDGSTRVSIACDTLQHINRQKLLKIMHVIGSEKTAHECLAGILSE